MSVVFSGTQLATIGIDHDLATITASGDYLFNVDVTLMTSSDTLELRVKNKLTSSGSVIGQYVQSFTGAQSVDDRFKVSVPFRVEHEAHPTLKQTAGTGRNYPWSVWRVDS